jgi:regulatory protein YycI of two-component signal transduction system YycFG
MDWSKIKTIFIITFLVLNVFLAKEFLSRRGDSQLEHISKQSIEDVLKGNGIKYDDSIIPKEASDFNEFIAEKRKFIDKDIEGLKNQHAKISEDTTIISDFKKPIPLSSAFKNDPVTSFKSVAQEHIFEGHEYEYWKYDEEKKEIYLVQVINGQKIYNNDEALIVIRYDTDSKMTSYTQTMIKPRAKKEVLEKKEAKKQISALKALENLVIMNEIEPNSTITSINLGYHRSAEIEENLLVISPVWYFILADGLELYVRTMDGTKIDMKEEKLNEQELKTPELRETDTLNKEEIPAEKNTN